MNSHPPNDLKAIAAKINTAAIGYRMAGFQDIRARLKGHRRAAKDIFVPRAGTLNRTWPTTMEAAQNCNSTSAWKNGMASGGSDTESPSPLNQVAHSRNLQSFCRITVWPIRWGRGVLARGWRALRSRLLVHMANVRQVAGNPGHQAAGDEGEEDDGQEDGDERLPEDRGWGVFLFCHIA